MRPSHASAKYREGAPELPKSAKKEKWSSDTMVKGRNEPATIAHVAHIIAGIHDVPASKIINAAWSNSVKMFGFDDTVAQETS